MKVKFVDINDQKLIKQLVKEWKEKHPAPVVFQKNVYEVTGGALKAQSMANLDSRGDGPGGKFYIRGAACWESDVFFKWLLETFSREPRNTAN